MPLNNNNINEISLALQDLAEIEKEKGDEYYETISVHTEGSQAVPRPSVKSSDSITRIYACCTMWHETRDEMIEFLKSILRLDEDQCARRVAQKYLRIVDPDYYEFESEWPLQKRNIRCLNPPALFFAPLLTQLTYSSTMPSRSPTTPTQTFR